MDLDFGTTTRYTNMTLEEMYELNQKALKSLYNKIKDVKGVKAVEECGKTQAIEFKNGKHTFYLTAEFVE